MQDKDVIAFINALRHARSADDQRRITYEASSKPELVAKLRILVQAGLLQMNV